MAKYLNYNNKEISVGDSVRVHVKIQEGEDKFRIQMFEGILIAIDNKNINKMFTVRKIAADGIGVERLFPVDGPMIANIEVKKKGNVRRAKLHYLRNRIGKESTNIKQQIDVTETAPAAK
ncbi:MAG TPA: 50S ribosomal protein L19 [Candidatus Saccharimonadia bacterium]|nr:50S ribosomal protein L19 [Candidatus Saccharimonadia bacterium]